MTAAEGGLDPRSWKRTADYMLASKTNKYGEKVGGVRVTNCHTDDPAAAATLIEATQAANTRSKTDKTYHMVFSFPPGENPSLEILNKIEDELVASIGYADHQRLSAVHIDTDHLHVHVAINKVHPTGFQNIEPYYDKIKLMETCERLEIEYGLERTNHGLTGQRNKKEREAMSKPKLTAEVAQAEAHSGIESLIGHVSREVAPAMREAKTWQELHGILAKHGLQIKKRGAGLVIGNGQIWAKASQADREFSLKKLTDKLGEFEKPIERLSKEYEPKPVQKHPSSAKLFEAYQQEKAHKQKQREKMLAQHKYEAAKKEADLQRWKLAERLIIKAGFKPGPERRAMLKAIKAQTQITREMNRKSSDYVWRDIMSSTHTRSWPLWLTQQAENGNTEALDVLRSREAKQRMQGDYLTAPEPGATVIANRVDLLVNQKGEVNYYAADGGLVIDRKTHVQSFRTTSGSTQLALELAAKRFSGQALIVEGQEQFKKDVARLAGAYGIQVRFADPEIEKTRKEALPEKHRVKQKTNEAEL